MKRILSLVAAAVTFVSWVTVSAFAQTVVGYNVTLMQNNSQTGASTVVAPGTPYMATASLTASSDPSAWTNVKVTPPGGVATNMNNVPPNVTYSFNAGGATGSAKTGDWGFEYTLGSTNTATMSVTGSFISAVPVGSDNGSFVTSGGPPRWEFNPSQAITLSWSSPSGYTSGDIVRLIFSGPGNPATWSGTNETSHTFSAGYFQSGQQYTASLMYQHSLDPYTGGFSGVPGVGVLQTYTNFTLQAVPEPSTYAAMFGLAALGFAAWRRRRQG